MSLRAFWRTNFSRKWVFEIKVHYTSTLPLYYENIGRNSNICILNNNIYVTLNESYSISPQQRKLLESAYKNCNYDDMGSNNLVEVLKEYLLNR